MLTTIIAWIYITFLSYSWGTLFLQWTSKGFGEAPKIHPSIVCFTGIALIAAVANLISFFLPLGMGLIQLIFLIPVILNAKRIWREVDTRMTRWYFTNIILFTCCVVTVLVMSTFTISHPDSLGYHVQIIKWIEEYKVVPGLANLNARLGFQSNWFVVCALFNFKFLANGSYVYLNSVICIWLLFFVISKLNASVREKKQKEIWLWTGFIMLTLSSYTQVLLTATSASPDYIAAIYIWLVLYFLFNSEKGSAAQSLSLVIIFSFFAFCVKMSTIPVLIAGMYSSIRLFSSQYAKAFFAPAVIATSLVMCFFARNAITSGYIVYPSVFPNIINSDWKVPEKKAHRERLYVTAFARAESGASDEAIAYTNQMSSKEWLPVWWSKRSLPDKVILVLSGLSFIMLIFSFKKIRKLGPDVWVCTFTAVSGISFWFLMGPDPRFGFGFIIGLIGLVLNIMPLETTFRSVSQKLIFPALWALNLIILVYIAHRFKNYFSLKQLVQAAGVKLEPGAPIECEKTTFYIAAPFSGCGANPIPCIQDSCKYFSLRGSTITEGFKPKPSN